MKLAGKTAIVTGAGRGIGRACALALAGEGADVAVTARTQSEIDAVAAEVEALGRRALAVAGDVSREEDVARPSRRRCSGRGAAWTCSSTTPAPWTGRPHARSPPRPGIW